MKRIEKQGYEVLDTAVLEQDAREVARDRSRLHGEVSSDVNIWHPNCGNMNADLIPCEDD